MRPDTFRDRWRHVAMQRFAHERYGCTQVVILVLYEDMNDAGTVQVQRDALAARITRHQRTAQKRLEILVDAQLLKRVRRGQKHVFAIYQAEIPALSNSLSETTQGVPAESESQRVYARPPENPLSETTQGRPTLDKETSTSPVPSHVDTSDGRPAGDDADPSRSSLPSLATDPTGQPGTQPTGMRSPVQTEPHGDEDRFSSLGPECPHCHWWVGSEGCAANCGVTS